MNIKAAIWIVVSLVVLSHIIGFITIESDYVHAAAVIHVGSGPGNDSANISGGIILASDGDTVFVHAGVYSESIVVNKTITLMGEGKEGTVINGSEFTHVIQVSAHWVNITGFEITGDGIFKGIYVKDYMGCSIQDNIIRDLDYGIFIGASSNNTISENYISGTVDTGIYIENSPNNDIIRNNITNSSYNGINLHQVSNNKVFQNNISECKKDGINFYNLTDSEISGNSIFDNSWYGIFGSVSIRNTIIQNNIRNNVKWAVYLSPAVDNMISENFISNNSGGIGLHDVSENNRILTNNVSGGSTAIYVESRSDIISDNDCLESWLGIRTSEADEITISNNIANGIELSSSTNITLTENTIPNSSKKIYVYFSDFNNIQKNEADRIHLVGSENNTISENTVQRINIDRGSNFNTFSKHDISSSEFGFEIDRSSNNVVNSNNVSNCTYAFHLILNARNNTISSNNLNSNEYGFYLSESSYNDINDNLVKNNDYGFYLSKSQGNVISNNSVISNNGYGFYLKSGENRIFHNSISDNNNQSYDETGGENHWDDGYPSGGNYWSDYLGYDNFSGELQDTLGADGLGDVPYIFDNNSRDNYPIYVSSGPILPMEPQNLKAVAGFSEITLTWQAPFSDGGDPVMNYKVYRGLSADNVTILAELGNVLTYTDSDVEKDIVYFYKVSAVNGISEGTLTEYVNATLQVKPASKGDEESPVVLIIVMVVIASVVLLLLVLLMRKKQEMDTDIEKEKFESTKKIPTTLDEQFPPQEEHITDSDDEVD